MEIGAIPSEKADMKKAIDITKLKGQSVVITGGASGLGKGMVLAFAEAGAYVTILDIQGETGEKYANDLNEKGYHVQFIQTDVTSWDDQVSAFQKAIDFSPHKSIDVVIPCAGIVGGPLLAHETSPPSLDKDPSPPSMKVIDINLKAEYTSAYLALYYFRIPPTSGHKSLKSLVFISSLAGYTDLPWASGYNAAKMSVRGIWKSLRSGIGALGIRSNLIAPWFVHTPMTDPIIELLKGSGMAFATVDGVVDAVVRCAVDETIQNRAIAVMPAGNFDLRDDDEGMSAGIELNRVLKEARGTGSAKDLLKEPSTTY